MDEALFGRYTWNTCGLCKKELDFWGHVKRKYGLTREQYLSLDHSKCNICAMVPEEGQKLLVDHDHETGQVRGMLCFNCNAGLGMFKDRRAIVAAAFYYLATRKSVAA